MWIQHASWFASRRCGILAALLAAGLVAAAAGGGSQTATAQAPPPRYVEQQYQIAAPDGTAYHWRDARACGVSCCYLLLKFLGKSPEYEEVRRRIEIDPERGATLEQLRQACASFGVDLEAVTTGPDGLRRQRFPVIAHLQREQQLGHYVVVLACDAEHVTIIDPTEARVRPLPSAVFMRVWSGHLLRERVARGRLAVWGAWGVSGCLVACGLVGLIQLRRTSRRPSATSAAGALPVLAFLASAISLSGCHESVAVTLPDRPAAPPEACRLVALNPHEDVGALEFGATRSATFEIENMGRRPVRVELGQPSCTCTRVELSAETVPPGGRIHIEMELANRGVVGPIRSTLNVAAPGAGWSDQLSVAGFGLGLKFDGPACRLQQESPGGYRGRLHAVLYTAALDCRIQAAPDVDPQFAPCRAAVNWGEPRWSAATPHLQWFVREVEWDVTSPGPAEIADQRLQEIPVVVRVEVDGVQHEYPTRLRWVGAEPNGRKAASTPAGTSS